MMAKTTRFSIGIKDSPSNRGINRGRNDESPRRTADLVQRGRDIALTQNLDTSRSLFASDRVNKTASQFRQIRTRARDVT